MKTNLLSAIPLTKWFGLCQTISSEYILVAKEVWTTKPLRLRYTKLLLLLVLPSLAVAPLLAQEGGTLSIFDYMVENGYNEAVVTTDLESLLSDRSADPVYQEADLLLTNEDGRMESWEVEVKTRGKYRRRICDFAPLKLNFSKSQLSAAGLAEFDKYKLVTHCEDNRYDGETALLKEHLAYQMYQELTPYSYRVHLLRVRYVDSKGNLPSVRRHAFLIESDKQVEQRLGLTECEDCLGVKPNEVDREAENVHAVFQYMIGNTDFNLSMVRNLKLFKDERTQKYIPIAYDFDFSGLVYAGYAVPSKNLGQEQIGDRVFLGFQVEDSLIEATLAHFENKQDELFNLVRQQRRLSGQARTEVRTYLNSFFEHLEELQDASSSRTYSQLRQTAPDVVPAGADPEHFGVRR